MVDIEKHVDVAGYDNPEFTMLRFLLRLFGWIRKKPKYQNNLIILPIKKLDKQTKKK